MGPICFDSRGNDYEVAAINYETGVILTKNDGKILLKDAKIAFPLDIKHSKGTYLYEGDIIRMPCGCIVTIKWDNVNVTFTAEMVNECRSKTCMYEGFPFLSKGEVVGNTFSKGSRAWIS